MPLLLIENLHASFEKTPIVRGVDLVVNAGELHVIYGPNGSGKSTLGKVLLHHPHYTKTQGKIFFDGKEISNLETSEIAKRGIFLSHQTPPEISGVSAEDILRAAEKAQSKSSEQKRNILQFKKDLRARLTSVGLSPDFSKRHMNEGASGGERKKMEIASLLTLGAKLAFLDEIDSGLDFDALKKIRAGIEDFLKNKNRSILLVTHSEKIIQVLHPDKIHIFCEGRIVASGGKEIAEKAHSEGFQAFQSCRECIEMSPKFSSPTYAQK